MSRLEVHQFPCLSDNYGYLVHDPDSGLTAAIDTPEVEPIHAALDARGQEEQMGPRREYSKVPPQQLTLPKVNAYSARRRSSQADQAAAQLESYMAGLQRGRSTPLTSQAVIQPRLF